WKDVRIHEGAPGLAGAELSQFTVRVSQAERRLPGVDAGAEQLELEHSLQLAELGRQRAAHAEPALTDAGEPPAVLAEFIGERRQLGRPYDVEPVRIVLLRLVAGVEHRKPVDFERRFGLGRG